MPKSRARKRASSVASEDSEPPSEWEWADGIIDDESVPRSAPRNKPYIIKHTCARFGGERYKIGDTVQVNGTNSYKWVGLIRGFETNYKYDVETRDDREDRRRANVIWFHRLQDVLLKKQRPGSHKGEIYLGYIEQDIGLPSIIRHARVCSTQEEYNEHFKGQKHQFPDRDAVYVCPLAFYDKRMLFFDFDWKAVNKGTETDFDAIISYIFDQVKLNTKLPARKRKRVASDAGSDYEDTKAEDDNVVQSAPKTLKKSELVTPKKQRTSSTAFSTPSGPRIKKALQITPLQMRTLNSSLLDSPYKLAQANLHVSAVPTSLPCRQEEYNQILDHLEAAIDEGTGACIYISGVPGIGKTATVREVVRALNERVEAGDLDDFHFVEINGLKVLDPNQAYAMLWEALTGERVTPLHAAPLLDAQFKKAGPGRVPCVVLLDELDQLVMAKQTVLYNLFNWPTLPHSRLIVVAIANTMNLADMLPNKIQSRVGMTRVNFEPYKADQLIKIIESRLENVPGNIIEKDAIKMCAMRIANNTGDARKALDVCRRAVEIAEAETLAAQTPSKKGTKISQGGGGGKVTNALINSVLNDFHRHPIQQSLRHLPLSAKVFLAALISRARRSSGQSDVTFGDVMEEATRICLSAVNNEEAKILMRGVTSPRGLEGAGIELEICKIIDWEERGGRRGGRVGLQISEDDLNMAFAKDHGWKEMVK